MTEVTRLDAVHRTGGLTRPAQKNTRINFGFWVALREGSIIIFVNSQPDELRGFVPRLENNVFKSNPFSLAHILY